jgi:glycosyltransferase involved in cell wall biosynthesis
MVDPDDYAAFASAIKSLWFDDDRRCRLAEAGKERVKHFNWDHTARLFRAHYRRLASKPLTSEDIELLQAPPIV